MESAFQSPVSPSADPDRGATHRQVMSAQPTRVLEGEASGPDYSLQESTAAQNGGEPRRSQDQLPNGVQRELPVQGQGSSMTVRGTSDAVEPSGEVQVTASASRDESGAGMGVQGGSSANAHPLTFAIHTPRPPTAEQPLATPQQSRERAEPEGTMPPPFPYASSRVPLETSAPEGRSGPPAGREGEVRATFGDLQGQPYFGELPYFQPQGDPPRLPQPLREPERQGVWSGLARAGEALRRRMTGSTPASTPAYPSPDRQPTQGNLLNPTMARAMYEWTARPSLLTPTAPLRPREPEQASHTSSIPQELIMQEVRQQVSEAMKSKDGELRELRAQNEELRSALRESLDAVKDLKGGGGQRHGDLPRDRAEEPGREPGEASVGAERTGDVKGPQGLHEPRSDGDLGKSSFPSGDNKESSKVMGEDLSGLRRLIDGSHREGAGASRPLEPVQETPKVDKEEVQEPLQLLVQGMRQLQQVFLGKSESKDSELKGSVQIPQMPEAGPESAVEYADWLFEAEQAIGGLSDRSALWFSA